MDWLSKGVVNELGVETFARMAKEPPFSVSLLELHGSGAGTP